METLIIPIVLISFFTIRKASKHNRNWLVFLAFLTCFLFLAPLPYHTIFLYDVYIKTYKYLIGFVILFAMRKTISPRYLLYGTVVGLIIAVPIGFLTTLVYCGTPIPLLPIPFIIVLSQLFLGSFAEEMVFRGFLQKQLVLINKEIDPRLLVVLVSIIFGLVHFPATFTFVLLATFGGLIYGFVYHYTGKIEYSIMLHFMTNVTRVITCSI